VTRETTAPDPATVERDRREERQWQDAVGAALLDVPYRQPGSAAVFERQWERIATVLAEAPAGPIVEIGCGKGHLLAWLQRRFPARRWIGIDVSRAVRTLPEQQLAGVLGDGEQLPFRSGVAAAIIYDGALHHLIDYEHALEEAVRVLMPGGLVVIFEPVSSPFTRTMHRLLDPLVAVEYESPIDQRYKHAFDEVRIRAALATGTRIAADERTDVLAYPLTGCYAGSPFARHAGLLRALLALEARVLALPLLGSLARVFAWRTFICARKR
jgi:SAM-dependent methyltransferase